MKTGTDNEGVKLVVVGSVAMDTIRTPFDFGADLLGGSVSYACAAASFFTRVGMVGVAGTDFPRDYMGLYGMMGIDVSGLQCVDGNTFRWSGEYEEDMNSRRTISTELNVFASFTPVLPDSYRAAPFVLLGNISPELQLHVLSQVDKPLFVVSDTMDLWIETARGALMDVLARSNMLMLNDSEARLLTGMSNLKAAAARILEWGPQYVVVKKGEHGAVLAGQDGIFILPGYPVDRVYDPTGAGDSFAGAFMGVLAESGAVNSDSLRRALVYGAAVASFGVEAFSLDRFKTLDRRNIDDRFRELTDMMSMRPSAGQQ